MFILLLHVSPWDVSYLASEILRQRKFEKAATPVEHCFAGLRGGYQMEADDMSRNSDLTITRETPREIRANESAKASRCRCPNRSAAEKDWIEYNVILWREKVGA